MCSKPVTANKWHLHAILSPLELQEYESGRALAIDLNDEESVKGVVADYVAPFVRRLREDNKQALRTTLAYYIKRDSPPPDVLASLQDLTVNEVDDYRLFLTWLWQALFPLLEVADVDASDVVEVNDPMEMNDFQAGMSPPQ